MVKTIENDLKTIILDNGYDNILIYGVEVKDFHGVDKDVIYSLTIPYSRIK